MDFKKLFFRFFVVITFIFFSSCRIGLGPAIDTKSPEINVLSPDSDSIIRGEFLLRGEWSDDGTIESLIISLAKVESDEPPVIINGDFDYGTGTWSCLINPLDSENPIKDGTYEATISITDTFHHVTLCSRLFTIDNTPPVVVLQRPATRGSENTLEFDTYGQKLTLEGMVADENDVSRMVVKIYEDAECTRLLNTITKENVPPTVTLDLATYDSTVQNDYSKIYGTLNKEGKKNFYCIIYAYDGAVFYPKSENLKTDDDMLGNVSSSYYLYDEISTDVLSKYKITEVYKIMNGSLEGEQKLPRTEQEIKSVKTILDGAVVKKGGFSLNPASNPTFIVSGKESLKETGNSLSASEDFYVTNGSNIVVEVAPGLDGVPLDSESLSVYLIECDDEGVRTGSLPDDKIVLNTTVTKSGGTYKFVAKLDTSIGLVLGKSYLFGVDGYDKEKNPVVPNGKGFACFFTESGAGARLSITEPSVKKTYKRKGENLVIKGSVVQEEGDPIIEFCNNGTKIETYDVSKLTKDAANPTLYTFEYTMPAEKFSQTETAAYEIAVKAIKGGIATSTVYKDVQYDVKAPEFAVDSITPVAQNYYDISGTKLNVDTDNNPKDLLKYVNGTFEVKISLDDDDKVNNSTAKYYVYEGKIASEADIDGKTAVTSGNINLSTKKISIDTSTEDFQGKEEISIVLEACDEAGNKGYGFINDYHVCQDTDKPVILSSKVDFEKNTYVNGDTINAFEKGALVEFIISDDDGLKSYELFKGNDSTNLEGQGLKNVSSKSTTFKYIMPDKKEDEGKSYYYQIKAKDINNIVRETPVFELHVNKAISLPVISKIESTPEYTDGKTGSFTNKITITAGTAPYKLYRSLTESINESELGTNPAYILVPGEITQGATVTDTIPTPSNTTTYYYIVQDSSTPNLESNIMSVTCKVDTTAPNVLSITSPDASRTGAKAIGDDYFDFMINASDKEAGLAKIYYAFTTKSTAPAENEYECVSTTNGVYSIERKQIDIGNRIDEVVTTANLYEGKWTLYVITEDAVGNKTTAVTREFDIDKNLPTITADNPPAVVNANFTMTGTASDANGLESITISDGTYSKTVTLPSEGQTNWSATIEVGSETGKLKDGNHTLKIEAKDKMGRTNSITSSVIVDTVAPVVDSSISVPKGADFDNATVEFRGKVTDGSPSSGISKVQVAFADSSDYNTATIKTDFKDAEGTSSWSYSCDVKSADLSSIFATEGTKYIFVKATDAATNESTIQSAFFEYDKDAPELSAFKYVVGTDENDITEGTSVFVGSGSYTLKGSFADSCSNVTISVTKNGTALTPTYPANLTTGEWSIAETGLSDGNYKYNILARDSSGRSSETKSFTIKVDKTAPTVASITVPSVSETENSSLTFRGTATDPAGTGSVQGSGIAKVYIGFTERTAGSTDWTDFVTAYGTENWNYTVDTTKEFTNIWTTEGKKNVYVYAIDNVGNVSAAGSKEFDYDTAKPVVNGLKYTLEGESSAQNIVGNTFEAGSLYTFSGIASDSSGIASVTVKESKDGADAVSVNVTGTTNWSTDQLPLTANRENGKPKSGVYTYEICAVDNVGKSSIITTVTVSIDVDPPQITITSPAQATTGSTIIMGTYYTFRGTVSDGVTGASGLKCYKYAILETATAPAKSDNVWNEESLTQSGTWTFTKDLETGVAPSSPLPEKIYEGHYYLYVYAEDNAGNKSDVASCEFYVDQSSPVISNVEYKDGEKSPIQLIPNQLQSYTNYLSTNSTSITLQGIATDSYGISQLKVNNEIVSVAADGKWTKDISVTSNEDINCEIKVVDMAGRETVQTYTLYNDKNKPLLEITAPDSQNVSGENSLNGSSYTFRFAASDDDSGMDYFEYLFTDTKLTTEQAIKDSATALDAQTKGWVKQSTDTAKKTYSLANGKTPVSPAADTIYEGEHYLYLYGQDKCGNYSTVSLNYWVDLKSPVLKEETVGATGTTVTASNILTLGGKVSDANGITKLIIKDDLTTNEWSVDFIGDGRTETSWEKEISCGTGTDKLIDGEHILTIIATDGASKETTLSRTVVVDTSAPKNTGIEITTTPDWKNNEQNWFKNATVGVKIKGVQDIASASNTTYASGVSDVQYTTDTGENPSWISMTKGTPTGTGIEEKADWTANVYCPEQGFNQIKFRIIDKAGNVFKNLSTTVYIDTEKPAFPTAITVDNEQISGNKLINGRNSISISITVADTLRDGVTDTTKASGIKQIVYKGLTDYTFTCANASPDPVPGVEPGSYTYKFDIPASYLKTGQAKFVIYDNVGLNSEWSPFSFTLDKTAPTVKIIQPNDADTTSGAIGTQVNGTIELEGTAKDVGGAELESIDICYYTDSSWKHLERLTGESLSSWTTSQIDTKTAFGTIADGTKIILCAIATDSAGNKNLDTTDGTTVTDNTVKVSGTQNLIPTLTPENIALQNKCEIFVNQDTDRPVIKFSTIDLNGDAQGIIWLKNQTKLVGIISDDDGIKADTFKICKTDSSTESDWKQISLDESGSWSFDLADFYTGTADEKETSANALNTLYFKVEDVNGTKFKSKESGEVCNQADFNTVKLLSVTTILGLLNADNSTLATSTILPLTVDTLPPTVEISGAKLEGDENFATSISTLKFGGSKKKFFVSVVASDGKNQLKTNGVTGNVVFGSTNVSCTATVQVNENDEYILTYELTDAQIAALKSAEFNDRAEIKVVAEDKAGNKASQSANLTVDFKNPEITLTAPSQTQYSSGNVTAYGTIDSSNSNMYYAISQSNTTEPEYQEILGTTMQWFVYFDGGSSTQLATHDKTLKDYIVDFGITTLQAITNKTFTDIVPMYLWVKAVDDAGNQTVEKYTILVDPQGDAPHVTIEYPEKDGATLGGTVTLRGTATDTIGTNIGIDSVWVQLVPDSDGTNFAVTMTDVNLWCQSENQYEVYTDITSATPTKVSSVTPSSASGDAYYIKASFAGSSWSLKINNNGEFNPASGETKNVAFRVYAKDNDNNLSRYEQKFSVFDSDSPVISNVYLRQYSDNTNGTGTVIASRAYEPDMWVKGKWWLYGTVKDTQGIASLKVNSESQTVNGFDDVEEHFNYPLGTESGVGSLEILIEAEDDTEPSHTGTLTCTINYDNENPNVITLADKYKTIQNSNGFFAFKSDVKEDVVNKKAQSGFDYLAFWVERNISGKHVVFDVMRSKANSEVLYTSLSEDSGLMWTNAVSVTRNENSLATLTLPAVNPNVHTGGLCKIGGAIYIISNVSGTTVTLSGQPEYIYTQAQFALASVINNTIESGSGTKSDQDGKYGYYESISNDDGDSLVESVTKSGTTWTWEVSINSQNIADGTVILHYVAFDKAGNYTADSIQANVANNAPRLASLEVWSDYNEDGTKQDGEFETRYFNRKTRMIGGKSVDKPTEVTSKLIVSGNDKDYQNGGSKFMTVKAQTKFYPEIVGGNGALYYSRKIGTATQINGKTEQYGKNSFGTGHDDGQDEIADKSGYLVTDSEDVAYIQGHKDYELTVTTEDLSSLSNGLTWFNYTIYDSTDGCTAWNETADGTNGRLSAQFQVALDVQYNDEEKPTAWFIPFYWKNKNENSIYWENLKPKGHIELPSDLPFFFNQDSGFYDKDPKVSGVIKVEGYVQDNIKLKNVYLNFEGDHYAFYDEKLVSTYNGTWTQTQYDPYEGWGFEIQDEYCDGTGHRAKWTLIINTALIGTVCDVDLNFSVRATDARGTVSSDTAIYRVDVVPYITAISTNSVADSSYTRNVTGLKDDNIRSASGKYSIMKGDNDYHISVKGFNLCVDDAVIVDTATCNTTDVDNSSGTYVYTTDYDVNGDCTECTLSNMDVEKSGYLELFVNGVRSINNINNNDAHGEFALTNKVADYENMPNREPDYNTTKNVRLTDDRYIRFFDMHETTIKNGYYPNMLLDENDNLVFGYVDSNGAPSSTAEGFVGNWYNACAMPQRAYINKNGTITDIEYLVKGPIWEQMAMARDAGGKYYNLSVIDREDSSMCLIYDRYCEIENMKEAFHAPDKDGNPTYTSYSDYGGGWGPGAVKVSYSFYEMAEYDGNNAIALDNISYESLQVGRYQYPKMIAKGDSTTGTASIYLSYYDDLNKEICFRDFNLFKSDTTSYTKVYEDINFTYYNNSKYPCVCSRSFGNLTDKYICVDNVYYKLTMKASTDTKYYYYAEGYSVPSSGATLDVYGTGTSLSDNYKVNFNENASNSTTYSTGRHTAAENASQFYSMAVTSDNYVILVYFDNASNSLKLKYSSEQIDGSNPFKEYDFIESAISLPKYVGTYVSMALDSSNGVHISAFNSKNSDLSYIYIPNYNGTSYQSMTVDQFGSVGNWTQIKLNDDDVPYIAYTNATENGQRDSIKLAYANASAGSVLEGVDDDNYTTGNWEYMTVPAIEAPQSGTPKFQNVCLDFDSTGHPVVGYLASNIEFGKYLDE